MKRFLILAILATSLFVFSGCVREVEVSKKLPIYDKAKCQEAHRVKTGATVVIGNDVIITMDDIRSTKATFIIVPKSIPDEIYLDQAFIYTKKNALNLTDCIRWERNRGDKYEAYNIKNNEGL